MLPTWHPMPPVTQHVACDLVRTSRQLEDHRQRQIAILQVTKVIEAQRSVAASRAWTKDATGAVCAAHSCRSQTEDPTRQSAVVVLEELSRLAPGCFQVQMCLVPCNVRCDLCKRSCDCTCMRNAGCLDSSYDELAVHDKCWALNALSQTYSTTFVSAKLLMLQRALSGGSVSQTYNLHDGKIWRQHVMARQADGVRTLGMLAPASAAFSRATCRGHNMHQC
jgi:hypothetical protein